jgi:cytochrome d ubiquinol oxidase subunit I
MGIVLVYLEWRYLRTKERLYHTAAKFWTRVFALNFSIGVASGIVLEFQFGTNWATYSRFVGDVFGSALAAEGIFAFFLESGFLAVLVFGWDKVSPGMHFFSTLMVSLGSIFSSVWIVVANSWQQTPAGHHIVETATEGVTRAEIVDFWELVFNPSTMHRLVHVWIGAFLAGTFFIMSISAYYMLRRKHVEFARHSFRGALAFATISAIAVLFSGHAQAKNVYEYQPAKLAAFEGHFETGPADLSLIGIPDEEAGEIKANLSVPGGLSLLLHGDSGKEVIGLDRFREEDRPSVALSFFSYHLMIGLGSAFVVLCLVASWFAWRRTLVNQRWLLWIFVFAVIGPILANESGWVAAEVGRQPWIVHPPVPRDDAGDLILNEQGVVTYDEGLGLRTLEAGSPVVDSSQVLGSIVAFGLIYLALFAVWLFILDRKIKQGPDPLPAGEGA